MNNTERPSQTPHVALGEKVEAHYIIEIGDSEFINSIEQNFGLKISQVEKVIAGYSSQVYRAQVDDETVFIRINRDPHVFPTEIEGYKIFQELGIPVPRVLAYEAHPSSIGHPTIILSKAEGAELRSAELSVETEEKIYEEIGAIAARIHSVPTMGFGEIHVEEGKLKGEYNTWREHQDAIGDRIESAMKSLTRHALIDENKIELVRSVHEEIAALSVTDSRLLHRDLHSAHVFVKDESVSGIIDLGALTAGDPRYDIATSFVYQSQAQQAAYRKGYGELACDPLVKKFEFLIMVRKLAFRLKYGSPEIIQITIQRLDALSEKIQDNS